MRAGGFNIFVVLTVYLSVLPHRGRTHDFKVNQPQSQTVDQDGQALISCEHTAEVQSVTDIRLYSVTPQTTNEPSKRTKICQKGMTNCGNIFMYEQNPKRWIFFIFNIRPKDMENVYVCEVTVTKDFLDTTRQGTPTELVAGKNETVDSSTPPPLPLNWILIGVLALLLLYSFTITLAFIGLWVINNEKNNSSNNNNNNREPEHSTYVEMRKAPLTQRASPPIYYDQLVN